MKFFNPIPISFLIGLIAFTALVWFGIAYLVADTGYPGGISPRDRDLILSTMSIILGLGGWLLVWRHLAAWRAGEKLSDKWDAFWGLLSILVFWGAALWFLVSAFLA